MIHKVRVVLVCAGLLGAFAVWGLATRGNRPTTPNAGATTPAHELSPEFRPPAFAAPGSYSNKLDSPEASRQLGKAAAAAFKDASLNLGAIDSIEDSVTATAALIGLGDVEIYRAFRQAYHCTIQPNAEAVADQQFGMGKLAGIDEAQWASMSPDEKFNAVASTPEDREATILAFSAGELRVGAGQRASIPKGFRAQGMNSGFAPPTPGLFDVGAETEWAWMEVPVRIPASNEVLLRLEFLRDPSVNAWIAHRATLLAPQSVRLPWIVF